MDEPAAAAAVVEGRAVSAGDGLNAVASGFILFAGCHDGVAVWLMGTIAGLFMRVGSLAEDDGVDPPPAGISGLRFAEETSPLLLWWLPPMLGVLG